MDTTKTDKRRRENRSEEARKAQTAAAVAATKARGITPREKGRENEETVLRWLADWGFSSPLLLSKLVGSQSIKRIEKNGLIERVETGSVFYPILYRLSGLGLQFANELVDMDAADRYDEIDSARIRLDKARHELTTQHLTIKAKMMDNSILPGLWHMENYWTERQFTDLFTDVDGKPIYAKNAKLPDAVWGARDWMTDEFMLVAVEIELTKKGTTEPHGKTRYKLDQFIYRVLRIPER